MWLVCLALCLTVSKAHGQLEKVKAHYKQLEKQAKDEPVTLQYVQDGDHLVEDYSRLSQIILIRHGEPALEKRGWKKRQEVIQYKKNYDLVDVYTPSFIPLKLHPGELSVIRTSSIRRAISTAEQVFQMNELLQADSLFREFELNVFPFPNVKLPTLLWLTVSRALWYLNMNDKGIESYHDAKKRGQEGANILQVDAYVNGKALLVAHGYLNRYLEKYLKKQGWKTVYTGGNGYLSQRMLVKYREE